MASASLSRSISSSPTNPDKFTVSMWIKRTGQGAEQVLLGNYSSSNFRGKLQFKSNDKLEYYQVNDGNATAQIRTTRVFRDSSAWYHLVVQFDTSQGTASDRIKIYVNGTQETVFDTASYPAQNLDMRINQASTTLNIGQDGNNGNYLGGELAHVHLADGQAYAPTVFAETDTTTGIWKPKVSPSVTYGDDGFFLRFDNSANMGLDSSGNSNNFSTSGTIIQTKDTPDNVFAVWNVVDWGTNYSTLSNCNGTALSNATAYPPVISTLGVSKGKYYWEVKYAAKNGGNDYPIIGITSTQSTATNHELGEFANDWGYYTSNGTPYYRNSASNTSYGTAYTVGDIIGVALDLDNNKLYFHKNGTYQNSGVPTSGSTGTGAINITDPASTTLGYYFAAASYFDGTNRGTFDANFGNGYFGTTAVSSAENPDDGVGIFEYDVPAGYRALCTKSINAQEYS